MAKLKFNILKKMGNKDIKEENKTAFEENKTADQENNQAEKENNQAEKSEETSDKKDDNQPQTPEDKVEAMGEKLQEINDKYLRLYSEFENYRKRTAKERIDLITNASEDLIKELLPVIDDFDRALESIGKIEDEQIQKTFEGVSLIYKKLYSLLERKGLKPINAKGEKFDENLHEAIAQLPAPNEEEKGNVVDETTKGYYLNDKVIRYSKVVVYM
ncbi:MAG: nucleotide exchange factor GrpE [Bacteroidales bacterium]|nr:nucleotide exchange factor GrpE [Bacteroidales bacterium]